MSVSSWENTEKQPAHRVFFSRYQLHLPRFEFFLALFLASLPFQLSLWQLLIGLSQKLFPPTNPFPWCYVRIILVFTTDFLFLTALAAILAFNRIPWRKCFWDGPAKYLLMLVVVSILSLVFSKTPAFPLQYVKLFQHLMPFLLFFLIPYCFKPTTFHPFLRGTFIALFAVGIIQSTIALIQYFTQEFLGLGYLGEEACSSMFDSKNGELTILGPLFSWGKQVMQIRRAAGTTMHSNTLGSILFLTLMISYPLYLEFRQNKLKYIVLMGIFIQIAGLFVSFSRSGLTASLIGTTLWLWINHRKLKTASAQPTSSESPIETPSPRRALRALLITITASIALCFTVLYPAIMQRGFANENDTVQGSNIERFTNFKIATRMIAANPVLGVGFDTYQIAKDRYNDIPHSADRLTPVHNSYLLIAAERGIIGLAIYLVFLFAVFKTALKTSFNPLHASLFIAFMGFQYLNCLDFGFLLMNNLSFYFYAFAALLVTPYVMNRRYETA
jgi:O-antigen ligase